MPFPHSLPGSILLNIILKKLIELHCKFNALEKNAVQIRWGDGIGISVNWWMMPASLPQHHSYKRHALIQRHGCERHARHQRIGCRVAAVGIEKLSGHKKNPEGVRIRRGKVKIPAPCYSPTLWCAVPSPLELLTTVFGKGTCVASPLWAPEIKLKKEIKGELRKISKNYTTTV